MSVKSNRTPSLKGAKRPIRSKTFDSRNSIERGVRALDYGAHSAPASYYCIVGLLAHEERAINRLSLKQ